MSLKALLFDTPGDTGRTDSVGCKILVGSTLVDDRGLKVKVFEFGIKEYKVGENEILARSGPVLNLWIVMSENIKVLAAEGTGVG